MVSLSVSDSTSKARVVNIGSTGRAIIKIAVDQCGVLIHGEQKDKVAAEVRQLAADLLTAASELDPGISEDTIKQVTRLYRTAFGPAVLPLRHNSAHKLDYAGEVSTARWMLDEIDGFVSKGRREKAFRWLGFVQAILWTNGMYTIEELAMHNKG